MNFDDIILDVFKTDKEQTIYLEEGAIPLTPFLAFAAMKRKKFLKHKSRMQKFGIKKVGKYIKAAAMQTKEKMRAATGKTSGKGKDATVYKLTDEQVDIMSDIYNKYGKKLAREIVLFRKNILAPYALTKRLIKQHSKVSSSDITGMTKEQFVSALESGRKKIQSRGGKFFGDSKDLRSKIDRLEDRLNALNKSQDAFEKGDSLDPSITSRVYKEFGAGDEDFQGYSAEELNNVYNKITRNYKDMVKLNQKLSKIGGSEDDYSKSAELRKASRGLWSGESIDLTKSDEFKRKGSFNTALGSYFFRRDILQQLKPGQTNVFRKTYLSIIKQLKEKDLAQKKKALQDLVSLKKGMNLTDREKKIWERRPTVKHFSNKIEDYYQKIKEEDFLDKPITIERSPKLQKAEQQIENEIKRFERKLAKIIEPDDLGKLKQFRLINHLITVRELESPEKLFKTEKEIISSVGKSEEKPEAKKDMSPDVFVRRIREIATMEFDTMREFNKAKQEAKVIAQEMKDAGEGKTVEKNKDILRQIERRRTLEKVDLTGHKVERKLLIDIDDIEKLIQRMITTNYTEVDIVKQDKQRLDQMIKDYKEADSEAERNLKELGFLMDKLDVKLKRGGLI